MKMRHFVVLILSTIVLSSCSTGLESKGPYAALKWTDASIFKESIGVEIDVVDDRKVSVLTSYSHVRLAPGTRRVGIHCFNGQSDGRFLVTADFEAGKTYRFEGKYEAGVFKIDLLEVKADERVVKASYSIPGKASPTKQYIPIFIPR